MRPQPAARRQRPSTTAALAPMPPAAKLAALVLLSVFIVQAAIAAHRDSVTIDEFVHLPVGLYILRTGDFTVDAINPPLARMLAAASLLSEPLTFAPSPGTPHWVMGYLFMQNNAAAYQAIFVRARMLMIGFTSLLGVLVFAWARQLYGWKAGTYALGLFAFAPDMLAHAHLVTLDMSGALGSTATMYATWRLLERPSVRAAAVTGAALGVATLLKLSGVALVASVLASILVHAVWEGRSGRQRSSPRWRAMLYVVVVGLVSLAVLNGGYEFSGTFAPLSSASLSPEGTLATLSAACPWLRLPLPQPLIIGIDQVMTTGKGLEPQYFLAGQLSSDGWWWYHLAAFALKSPIPLLVLSLCTVCLWCAGKSRGRREYCLFLPILFTFAANSLFNSLQIGVRHILPVYPLLFIAVSPWIVAALERRRASRHGRLAALAAAAGLSWYVGGSLWVAPRYLQYFNELAGGPEGGHRFLIDSNIDWGQDLIRLREYMSQHALPAVNLAYFGRVHPGVYGIRFVPLEKGQSHGPTVVSASFLMGRPYFWYQDGQLRWVHARAYSWLQQYRPVARVGSMFVFDLP
jgi:hypothetical protein